ncbi:MAG: ATP-binding protein [Oscillospiraceae bacterium]|nr:ATP-binding protein [Oscillospiraceae bacterium]
MEEKQNIEWKAAWKDEYLQWICGFANANGGSLYIGVDDNGQVIGVANAKRLLEDLPNKIRDTMGIVADINLLKEQEKEYIEITVPSYPVAISCKGAYYYRSGSTNQKLTGAELESFVLRRRGVTWDNMPLPTFRYSDIDDKVVERFKRWAEKKGRINPRDLDEPKEVLLERLHLTNAGYLTNAAMLLFSDDPEKWQLGAFVKVGYFDNDADLRYQDEIHGALLDQVDRVVEIVQLKYMKAMISYEGIQRIEKYFVPDAALREAVLNALCHKDYASGIPIQISVYADKLYISNCGRLPEHWTTDSLFVKHPSKPYNPNIAHVFYLAGFIESWGRGVEKICAACENDGAPIPEYSVNPGDIMIKFSAAKSMQQKVGEKVGEKVGVEVDDKELTVLNHLCDDPGSSYVQIAKKTGLSEKTIYVKIKSLKEKRLIERVGSDRNGYWKVNLPK